MFSSVIALLASLTILVSSAFLDSNRSTRTWGTFFQEQQTDQPRDTDQITRPATN